MLGVTVQSLKTKCMFFTLLSMCVCLCDYNTYYKCNNGWPAAR